MEQQVRNGLVDMALLEKIRNRVLSVTRPWWRGEIISENGLIYGINTSGSRPPLFWFFQGHTEFAALAGALGPDQPLYGMRSGHLVVDTRPEHLFHMALAYASEIVSMGLSSPIYIGGNCQGALMAQKTAQVLMTHDRAVALLIGLNPFMFMPYPSRAAFLFGRYDVTNPLNRFHHSEQILYANIPNCQIDILPYKHGELFKTRVLNLLSDVVRRRIDEAAGKYPGSYPEWSLRADIASEAPTTMVAGGLYDVPVTLHNTSDIVWNPAAQSGLSIGNHWRDADNTLIQWLDGLQPLDSAVLPGKTIRLSLLVRAPSRTGSYKLEIDLQHSGIMWISEVGGNCATSIVTVPSLG